MKKIIVLIMLVMLTSTFAYCANNANWRQLKSGMTESQVRSILGEPIRVEKQNYTNKLIWEYENFGEVTFNNDNIFFTYKVEAWSEPRAVHPIAVYPISTNTPNAPNPAEGYVIIPAIILLILVIIIYFLPSIIAGRKRKRNAGAIFALNLLLGWTFIGWVIAFIWSLTHDN